MPLKANEDQSPKLGGNRLPTQIVVNQTITEEVHVFQCKMKCGHQIRKDGVEQYTVRPLRMWPLTIILPRHCHKVRTTVRTEQPIVTSPSSTPYLLYKAKGRVSDCPFVNVHPSKTVPTSCTTFNNASVCALSLTAQIKLNPLSSSCFVFYTRLNDRVV